MGKQAILLGLTWGSQSLVNPEMSAENKPTFGKESVEWGYVSEHLPVLQRYNPRIEHNNNFNRKPTIDSSPNKNIWSASGHETMGKFVCN